MNKYSLTAIVALMLLAVAVVEAQEIPDPKIAYADLPTLAEIMAEYADEPDIVADAKRLVIISAVRRASSFSIATCQPMRSGHARSRRHGANRN